MSELIRVEHLHKVYRMGDVEVPALRGVDLTIARGEFVAVMGSSGSGKSTFMNILGCLDRPTAGKYFLEGQEVGSLTANEWAYIRNKRIGFVFQGFNLLSRTTALENVELPMMYNGFATKQRRERAVEALSLVGLGERHDHTPNQLSGGQQQRVAIAQSTGQSTLVDSRRRAHGESGLCDQCRYHDLVSTTELGSGHHDYCCYARARHRRLRSTPRHVSRWHDRFGRTQG